MVQHPYKKDPKKDPSLENHPELDLNEIPHPQQP